MRLRTSRSHELPHIPDISPVNLIDVLFLLLIFFMVSTTFQTDMGLDLSRPGAASSARQADDKAIRIFIDQNRNIMVEETPTKLWLVQGILRKQLSYKSKKSVLVVADKNLPTQTLIELVDQCRLAGADDVGVATEHEVRG